MHMFYFMYSISVYEKGIFVNQLSKELKQLDDLYAHIHNTIFHSFSLCVCLCVCVCISCLKCSRHCGQSDIGGTLNYQYCNPIF